MAEYDIYSSVTKCLKLRTHVSVRVIQPYLRTKYPTTILFASLVHTNCNQAYQSTLYIHYTHRSDSLS